MELTLKIKKGLSPTTVPVGAKIKLDIEVEGKPKTVKWYKAGNELTTKKDKRVKITEKEEGKYELEISEAVMEDMALYSVEVANDTSSDKSEAMVTVQGENNSFVL